MHIWLIGSDANKFAARGPRDSCPCRVLSKKCCARALACARLSRAGGVNQFGWIAAMAGRSQALSATDGGFFENDFQFCRNFTMVTRSDAHFLHSAVGLLNARGISGDILEAGVWKGGMSMLMGLAEMRAAQTGGARRLRDLWLMDTFEGLPAPGPGDDARSKRMYDAITLMHSKRPVATGACAGDTTCCKRQPRACLSPSSQRDGLTREIARRVSAGVIENGKWNLGTISEVRANMERLRGFPTEQIHYIKGKVEDTLHSPSVALPQRLALLRLDTDWHASTRDELEVLWPKLSAGGLMIIDDYYTWGGARKAVDDWLRARDGWAAAANEQQTRAAKASAGRPPWHIWKTGIFLRAA